MYATFFGGVLFGYTVKFEMIPVGKNHPNKKGRQIF